MPPLRACGEPKQQKKKQHSDNRQDWPVCSPASTISVVGGILWPKPPCLHRWYRNTGPGGRPSAHCSTLRAGGKQNGNILKRFCFFSTLGTRISPDEYLDERPVCQSVLVSHMNFHQMRTVCRQGSQGDVPQLLAPVCRVLLQAGTLRGQGEHSVVVDRPAVRDVYLGHILPSRGYFRQEFIIYLERQGRISRLLNPSSVIH